MTPRGERESVAVATSVSQSVQMGLASVTSMSSSVQTDISELESECSLLHVCLRVGKEFLQVVMTDKGRHVGFKAGELKICPKNRSYGLYYATVNVKVQGSRGRTLLQRGAHLNPPAHVRGLMNLKVCMEILESRMKCMSFINPFISCKTDIVSPNNAAKAIHYNGGNVTLKYIRYSA